MRWLQNTTERVLCNIHERGFDSSIWKQEARKSKNHTQLQQLWDTHRVTGNSTLTLPHIYSCKSFELCETRTNFRSAARESEHVKFCRQNESDYIKVGCGKELPQVLTDCKLRKVSSIGHCFRQPRLIWLMFSMILGMSPQLPVVDWDSLKIGSDVPAMRVGQHAGEVQFITAGAGNPTTVLVHCMSSRFCQINRNADGPQTSRSPSSDRGDFWAWPVEILVFASPIGYMSTSSGLPSLNWGIFNRFL